MKKNKNNAMKNDVRLSELSLPEDLKKLTLTQCKKICRDIRSILINTVSKNGGHLASNLGSVELTVAIHRVFNSPQDKIIWDVGHQSYTHKILTGRLNKFKTIRKENGISGFPKPSESIHDAFIGGHSSTSISVACGIAEAMKMQGNDDNYAIAVIGDGALTGGMVYEALNNGGKDRKNLIVILNHNDMSISKNVGALSKHLAALRANQGYVKTKSTVEKALAKTPVVGKPITKVLKVSKDTIKGAIYPTTTIFDDFGFIYLGPVDGHDISAMEMVLNTAKTYKHPVVVHVNTVKGKGYLPAEKNPGEYHGISKFDILTGNPEVSGDDSYSAVFGKELVRLAKKDNRICAVTAAMKYGTGLQFFSNEIKDRFFDVGIAEQHAVTFSAGLSSMGFIPVFAVYSSFLQRSYDQLIHDVAICNTHIVLGIDRAGIVGEDGETHQGIFDVPMLRTIPNTTIYSPSNYEELKLCLNDAIYKDKGIVCVRYPRGRDTSNPDKTKLNTNYTFTINRGDNNSNILLISYGRIYNNFAEVVSMLANENINVDTLKLTKIHPFDEDLIGMVFSYNKIFFFEECEASSGVSKCFSASLMEKGYDGSFIKVAINGFVKQASVESTLHKLNLDAESMYITIRENLF